MYYFTEKVDRLYFGLYNLNMRKVMGRKRKGISVKDFDNEELWLEFKALVVKKRMKIAEALEQAIKMWVQKEKGNAK